MSDVPSKKFLQLIKVSFDVSTGVVRDFAENNILGLPEYGGSFIKFLDLRKHEIYHKWQNRTPCCYCVNDLNPCPKENVKRKFDMLYQTISDRQVVCVKGKCPVKVNGCIKQYCICNIIPHQTLSLNEIDISMLSFLLRDCNITPLQLENIQNLYKQRCRLCHAYSTHCFSNDDYEDIWTNLEISTLELAKDVNHYYHKQSKEHLKTLKSHDFTPEEHSLLSRIFHELSVLQNTNNGIIKNGFTKCGIKIAEAKEEIIKNTDTKFAEMTEHIQQLTAKVNVLLSQKTSSTKSPNTANEDHKETSMHGNGEASNADLFAQQGAKPKQKPEGMRHVRAICHVEGKELDELSAVQTLTEDKHNLPSDLCFDIITAEQKCLLLQLAVPSKVLEDQNSFRMALRTLIFQIARAGKIDINKPNIITLNLRFEEGLTEENMRVIQELSSISILSKMVDDKLTFQHVTQSVYQGFTMQPVWGSSPFQYPGMFPRPGLQIHRQSMMNAAHHGVHRSSMPLTGDTPHHQAKNQYLQFQPMQLPSHTLQFPISAFHVPTEYGRDVVVERCTNCKNMRLQLLTERRLIYQLDTKIKESTEANLRLESQVEDLIDKNCTLLIENGELVNDIAALNMTLNRQQEVQGWIEDIAVSSGAGRRMGSRKSSGTGSMRDEPQWSPTPSEDSLSFII